VKTEEKRAKNLVSVRRYQATHREEVLERQRKRYRAHRKEILERQHKCYLADRERRLAYYKGVAARRRERQVGRPRPGRCELCHSQGERLLDADHDHVTGIYRGWLCNKCNRALGAANDDPALLRRMALWIEDHRPQLREAL
jgi:hypothetical protein